MPDWLRSSMAAPEVGTGPLKGTSELPDTDTPDWLIDSTSIPPAPAASSAYDVPDWLKAASESAVSPAPIPSPLESAPDWLAGLEAEQPAAPQSPVDDDTSGWLAGVEAEQSATPAAPADDTPDWMKALEEAGPVEPTPATDQPTGAGWLDEIMDDAPLTRSEASDPLDTELDKVFGTGPLEEPDTSEEAEPDWMKALDDVPMAPAVPQADQPEPQIAEQPVGEEDEKIDLENLPGWLARMQGEEGDTYNELPEAGPVDERLLAEIEDLTFDSLLDDEIDARPEQVGALRDVTGVLQPEMIFDGSNLSITEIVDDLIVTPDQQLRANRLTQLLQMEGSADSHRAIGRRTQLLVVRVAALLAMLGAVLAPFLFKVRVLPDAVISPQVTTLIDQIDELETGAAVLLAVEYEPDSAGELNALALAVLEDLSDLDPTIYVVSSQPVGPAVAQDVYNSLPAAQANSITWLNLGFVPGQATGLNSLVYGTLDVVPSYFASDYLGQETGIDIETIAELNVDMVIVMAARADEVRLWMEQVEPAIDAPFAAVVSAGARPMTAPYAQSGQLVAVLQGLPDAVAYEAITQGEISTSTLIAWNAQAVGGAAAAVLIIISAIVFGVMALRSQREQL